MHGNERVMKTHGDLVRRKRFVFNPMARIVQSLIERAMNFSARDAEILVGRAVPPSPLPNPPEHSTMQFFREGLADGIMAALKRPYVGGEDILLLKLV
jgi:hypothetical protein